MIMIEVPVSLLNWIRDFVAAETASFPYDDDKIRDAKSLLREINALLKSDDENKQQHKGGQNEVQRHTG